MNRKVIRNRQEESDELIAKAMDFPQLLNTHKRKRLLSSLKFKLWIGALIAIAIVGISLFVHQPNDATINNRMESKKETITPTYSFNLDSVISYMVIGNNETSKVYMPGTLIANNTINTVDRSTHKKGATKTNDNNRVFGKKKGKRKNANNKALRITLDGKRGKYITRKELLNGQRLVSSRVDITIKEYEFPVDDVYKIYAYSGKLPRRKWIEMRLQQMQESDTLSFYNVVVEDLSGTKFTISSVQYLLQENVAEE